MENGRPHFREKIHWVNGAREIINFGNGKERMRRAIKARCNKKWSESHFARNYLFKREVTHNSSNSMKIPYENSRMRFFSDLSLIFLPV
jgi:hypothetical protein